MSRGPSTGYHEKKAFLKWKAWQTLFIIIGMAAHGKLSLLSDWLRGRESAVVVKGVESCWNGIADQVFQGTVLGPPLWNIYFADVDQAVMNAGFINTSFADTRGALSIRVLIHWLKENPSF
jgi:hypothetical protein